MIVLLSLLVVVFQGREEAIRQKVRADENARAAEKASKNAKLKAQEAREQRDEAERQGRIALARQLETQSELAFNNTGEGLVRSALLAVESLKAAWTLESYIAWDRGMSLLPHPPVVRMGQEGDPVRALAFSWSDRSAGISAGHVYSLMPLPYLLS